MGGRDYFEVLRLETQVDHDIHTTSSAPQARKSILVIDDSPDLQTLSRTILEMEGYEVITAESGKEALSVLAEIEAPDLILLDMQMDDVSGPEFLKILEIERPEILEHVPVVFLTGMDQVPQSKATGVIHKSFDIEPFLAMVTGFLDLGGRRH